MQKSHGPYRIKYKHYLAELHSQVKIYYLARKHSQANVLFGKN